MVEFNKANVLREAVIAILSLALGFLSSYYFYGAILIEWLAVVFLAFIIIRFTVWAVQSWKNSVINR